MPACLRTYFASWHCLAFRWGMGGICPGPGILAFVAEAVGAASGGGGPAAVLHAMLLGKTASFLAAMVVGMKLEPAVSRRL